MICRENGCSRPATLGRTKDRKRIPTRCDLHRGSKRMQVTNTCAVCAALFETPSSQSRKFCSRTCSDAASRSLAPPCKFCGAPAVRGLATWLVRCESPSCVKSARKAGGRSGRGRHSPRRGMKTSFESGAVHRRARATLPKICGMADDTCTHILDAALRDDAPLEWLVTDDDPYDPGRTRVWFVDVELPIEAGYWILCRKHHMESDGRRLLGQAAAAAETANQFASTRPDFLLPGTWREYGDIHNAARGLFGGVSTGRGFTRATDPCELLDDTCAGLIEVSMLHYLPPAQMREVVDDGRPIHHIYFVGPIEEGYRPLCQSHNTRYDRGLV